MSMFRVKFWLGFALIESVQTIKCPPGMWSETDVGTRCFTCDSGHFGSTMEVGYDPSYCVKCPKGYYGIAEAQTNCVDCAAGECVQYELAWWQLLSISHCQFAVAV